MELHKEGKEKKNSALIFQGKKEEKWVMREGKKEKKEGR